MSHSASIVTPLTRHTIPIHHVTQILLGARRRGLAIEPLLHRARISTLLLESPTSRVTPAQLASLIRVLRRATRDEFWGLLDRPVPLGTFAQGCRLLSHTRTLGEALRVGLAHYHLALQDLVPRLQVRDEIATVRIACRVARDPSIVYAERVLAFLALGLASWFVARRIPLLEVMYPRDVGSILIDETRRVFQAPIRLDQDQMGWRFQAAWLDLPVVQNGGSVAEFLRQAPASLLVRYRDQSSLTERIRRLLRRHLSEEMPTLEVVGAALSATPQTLRRRLRDEGQSYQAIKDDLRRDAAIDQLARGEMSLKDIAQMLGFSEVSTFHRAFKNWTGVAPGEYRLRQRGASSGDDRSCQSA